MKNLLLFFALIAQFSIMEACLSKPVIKPSKIDLKRSLQSRPTRIKRFFAKRAAAKQERVAAKQQKARTQKEAQLFQQQTTQNQATLIFLNALVNGRVQGYQQSHVPAPRSLMELTSVLQSLLI